jgi:TM2 domain-containing membrane protein YozV
VSIHSPLPDKYYRKELDVQQQVPQGVHSMNRKLIAILLSGLVMPGLGQLYLGRKIKGGILIFLVNLFILAALAVLAKGLGKLFILAHTTGAVDQTTIIAALQEASPFGRWLIGLFLVIWVYAIMDVVMGKAPLATPPESTR